MIYNWKIGSLFPVGAQQAGEFFENLEERKGGIKPKDVVEESRTREAVLHPCFEWNDDIAAEKHREQQARTLIGNLVVVKEVRSKNERKNISVRAYVNTQESKYINISTAISETETCEYILRKAIKELQSFKTKYNDLMELTGIFEEIDKLAEEFSA